MSNNYQTAAGTDFQRLSSPAAPMALWQQDARERLVDAFFSIENLGTDLSGCNS